MSPGPAKATVFFFIRPDCPISNRYAPEVAALESQFGSNGIAFRLVYADPDLTPAEIRKHIDEYSYPCGALRDPAHELVTFCRARVTPEAAIVTAEGRLVYHGRIDDRYVTLGRWKPEPTRRDLELALHAVLHGTAFPPSAPAVGCRIPPLTSE